MWRLKTQVQSWLGVQLLTYGAQTAPRLCSSASMASVPLTDTRSWPELSPPSWGLLNWTRGRDLQQDVPSPLPSVKAGETKLQNPEEEARDLIKSPHPAGGSRRKCLFSFQRCGMLLTGPAGPAFPDTAAQGPEMTSIREALGPAEGLRGGRRRGHRPRLRRADSCTFPACRVRAAGGRLGPPCGRLCARGNRGAAESLTPGRGGVRFLGVTGARAPAARHLDGAGSPASPPMAPWPGSQVSFHVIVPTLSTSPVLAMGQRVVGGLHPQGRRAG